LKIEERKRNDRNNAGGGRRRQERIKINGEDIQTGMAEISLKISQISPKILILLKAEV